MKTFFAKIWKFLRLPKKFQLFVMNLAQDQFLVGVIGVILNDKNEILLFKHTYRDPPWDLPGGYIRAKEHPSEGLEREIEEESGFVVSIDDRLKIRTDRESARLEVGYIGEYIGGTFTPSSEVSAAAFYTFSDLPLIPKGHLMLVDVALRRKQKSIQRKPSVQTYSKARNFIDKFRHEVLRK